MNEEAAFVAALVADPSDRTAALVFADWLDERGDPRGPLMRLDAVRAWMAPEYGDPLPKLRAALETGKRVNEAVKALALIGEPAVPELIPLLASKTAIVRARAAKVVRMMGPRGKAALPALLGMANDPFSMARREASAAARTIIKGVPKDTAWLREALHDKDDAVRRQAAALLGVMYAKRAVKNELAKGLDSPDPAARLAAVEAMANLRTKTAADSLCKALADTSAEVRCVAARQLLSLAGPTMTVAVEPLRKALADESQTVRNCALGALGKIGPAASPAVPDLFRSLSETAGTGRERLTEALFQIGAGLPEVLDVVLAGLRDPEERVRHRAGAALSGWTTIPASAVPTLLELVRRPNTHDLPNRAYRPPVHVLAVRAGLRALARIPGPPPEVWDEFRSQLAGNNADIAAEVTEEIGPSAVVLLPELIAALSRPGALESRGRVGKAIGRLGGEGLAALVRALDNGPVEDRAPAGGANDLYWRTRHAIPAAAAEGLEEAGPAALSVLPALLDRLRRPMHPQVRALVVSAVAAMGPGAAGAIPDLLALLDGEQLPNHGSRVFHALQQFGPAVVPFVPHLTALLRQPERAASHADIVRVLTALIPHGVEVLPAFRDVLRRATADDVNASAARAATAGLAALGPAAAAALPDLALAYRTFTRYPPGDLRENVLAAYGTIGGAAVPLIRGALADSVLKIRLAAVEALGATGDTSEETVDALRAAETDAATKVRTRAAAVLKNTESRNKKRG